MGYTEIWTVWDGALNWHLHVPGQFYSLGPISQRHLDGLWEDGAETTGTILENGHESWTWTGELWVPSEQVE